MRGKVRASSRRRSGADRQVTGELRDLGYRLLSQGRHHEAIIAFRRSLAVVPADAGLLYELGRLLFAGTPPRASGDLFERALAMSPGLAEAANGLAFWHFRHGRHAQAIVALRKALAARPDSAEFRSNTAAALKSNGEPDEATIHARIATALAPASADAHNNLGDIEMHLGDALSAIRSCRRALAVDPRRLGAHRNLLVSLLYDAETSPEALFRENQRLARNFTATPRGDIRFPNEPDPERRLTVGYVSSDFRNHSIARVTLPWFSRRDPARFRLVVFSDVPRADEMTERFRALCDDWHVIRGLADDEVAELIRRAGIDILVVVAGHFDENRQLLASYRPAPIVISAHGGTTSGVEGTHYLIADATVAPKRGVERFTERVIRLPVFSLQSALESAPEIEPLPAASRGYVTFVSFNNLLKTTPATVALWARVLKAVPGSRLMIKYANILSSRRARERLAALFRVAGVGTDRIVMAYAEKDDESAFAHLARYGEADIALDTVPFNGSTTTFEALWMGVPVVTLCGRTMMSRWSAAMLERVGHPEWIASDEEAYVGIAAALASDLGRLAALRRGLRTEVAASRLCNVSHGVAHLERAYRTVWRRWCAERRAA
ncbi:MAG: tetratricopeptide repeat protein [Alphaproteobacteria bacterium]|nr:tetratricopeptide repeat protein [Alphaproteobacteria bacterium]